ncbi:SusC/RagA family TonB-linked outer membrane protein [Niabella ginsengisoli]|uniref:TonB-dependent receptor n=1 Tax=Niabella ginsengisoli TaxID=522298 RepID=A0ABS9SI48_9BACT|nr:TonB-dependent receptor [Niabella ginsengisoli]MCH5598000.1 TonB-dependent receptor [Niabella ginsengisoli]
MNPDDIATFSIMKDATATALYGARGANGVILVTTKEGKQGEARISLRAEGSMSMPTRNIELADPVTYMKLNNEAILTRDPLAPVLYSDDKINSTIPGSGSLIFPSTDWRSEMFKEQAFNQRVNLNVSGGGKIARYYVAGNFNQDNGVLKVDKRNNFNNNINLKTYSLRSNVNVNVFPTTEMIIRLSGVFDDYKGPIYSGGGFYTRVMRANPVLFPAYYPIDEDHQYVKHIMFGNFDDGRYLNPYADMVKGYKDYSRSNVNAQIELKQDLKFLTPGLRARARFNTTRESYFDVVRQYNPFYYQLGGYNTRDNTYQVNVIDPDGGTEYLDYNEGQRRINSSVYVETALEYNRTFQQKHNLSGMLIYIMREALTGNAGSLQASLPYRNLGFSGRTTYGFKNKYYAEFNFGYNGSERFYKDQRWGFFPSAGLAWSVSNEAFWEPFKNTVNHFKVRGTYGLVGNDAIGSGRFLYLSEVNMADPGRGSVFGRENGYSRDGISISRYSDNAITWETAQKMNVALEIGLFRKIDIIAEYFREHRYNILQTRASTPASMGLWVTPAANIGEAMGHGVDISLDYNHTINNDMWLQARGNFTYATSEFRVYEEYDYANEWWKSRVGYPISQTWGYIAEHLFADDAEVASSPVQNFGTYMAGDIKYRDVNNDGRITELDMVPIGYPTTPEIVYGFGFSYGFKSLDFSAFLQGAGRESFWVDPDATAPFVPYYYSDEERNSGTRYTNQLLKAYADSYWSEDNRNLYAMWPRLSSTVNNNNTQTSTWFMRNGAFLRLKQVELGFTLPKRWISKRGMSNARIYVNGTNLLTWSKFKLWDIEMAGNGLQYPIQKVYNIGLNVSL